jgi:hypothetical protein
VRPDAAAQQVQAIRIPANLHGWISFDQSGSVVIAGVLQQGETCLIEIKYFAAQQGCELGASAAMPEIDAFIDPAGIMENGKEL